MTYIEELQQKYTEAVAAKDAAWRNLRTAIIEASPVKVGDIIQLTEDGVPEGEVYLIASAYCTAYDTFTDTFPRFEVRKKTKKGWHSVQMRIGGLSHSIHRGQYIQLTPEDLILKEAEAQR